MVGVLVVLGMISTTITYLLGLLLMIVCGVLFRVKENR